MSAHSSPFTKRLAEKLRDSVDYRLTYIDANAIRKAFVEALKEEVEARFGDPHHDKINHRVPLVIAGLGSFKMRTRSARTFINTLPGSDGLQTITTKPSRRLIFTAKWEPIK